MSLVSAGAFLSLAALGR